MTIPILYLSHDPDFDYLRALEFGRVPENQPPRCWLPLGERFAYHRPPRARKPRGFSVHGFSDFDEQLAEHAEIWRGPRFSAPLLGLQNSTAGEIVLAARAYFDGLPSINRVYFDSATRLTGEEALQAWRFCLESGDAMAHFAIGYTLFELGRVHEAYSHLRTYAEIAPDSSWNWCWFGKAAQAVGERGSRAGIHPRSRIDQGRRRRNRRAGAAGRGPRWLQGLTPMLGATLPL